MGSSWRGRWWIPGREDAAAGGELESDPEDLVLTIDGELPHEPIRIPEDGRITELFHPAIERIVLGETRDGERITLVDCEGSIPAIPGRRRFSHWRPAAVLLGSHIESSDELSFDALRCSFDYLADWARGSSLGQSITLEESGGASAVSVEASSQTIGTASLGRGKLLLVSTPTFSVGERRAEVGLFTSFRVELSKPMTWRRCVDEWLRPLRNLVSLASLRANRIGETFLRIHAAKPSKWVELVLQWTDASRPERTERSLIPQEMLFTADDMPGGFGPGITQWLELHRRHESVVVLLLGVGYAPFMFDEQRFLALSQALEIYHREAIGGTPLPTAEHRRKVEDAIQALSGQGLAEWAEPILRNANYLHLRDRVTGVIGRLGDLASDLVGEDSEAFVGRIVKTRNYLTHLDDQTGAVTDEAARYLHGQALDLLLRASLLLDLGFSLKHAADRIRRIPRYGWVKHGLNESLESGPP